MHNVIETANGRPSLILNLITFFNFEVVPIIRFFDFEDKGKDYQYYSSPGLLAVQYWQHTLRKMYSCTDVALTLSRLLSMS